MNDDEYRQTLHDIQTAVSEIEASRNKLQELKDRKADIFNAMDRLLTDALSLPDPDRKWDAEFQPLRYNVHFRLTTGKTREVHHYSGTSEIHADKIGFFFTSGAYPGWKVRDYNNTYGNYSSWTDQSMLLIIDYAEDIIDKARTRMKLKKYRDKYDLNPLIDTLHSLSVLRGDTYMVRAGTPPVKIDGINPIDPITGKVRKQRGSHKINIPFKIKSVVVV